jgi:hypothetical protein
MANAMTDERLGEIERLWRVNEGFLSSIDSNDLLLALRSDRAKLERVREARRLFDLCKINEREFEAAIKEALNG